MLGNGGGPVKKALITVSVGVHRGPPFKVPRKDVLELLLTFVLVHKDAHWHVPKASYLMLFGPRKIARHQGKPRAWIFIRVVAKPLANRQLGGKESVQLNHSS